MYKKILIASLVILLSISLVPISNVKAAETISIKLVNYIGNKTSIEVTTNGSYRVKDNNQNTRITGNDRFDVANSIADKVWDSNSDTVILAYYNAFADALAAAPLAYKKNAPILLTQTGFLTEKTKQKIIDLQPREVIIVGGPGSVSNNVLNQVDSIVSDVRRIGGADRFEVAYKISRELGSTNTAIVTNGLVFADALSIAPYAARQGYPILLTTKDSLPTKTRQALEEGRISNTYIIGGTGSVSNNINVPSPTRIGGADRFEVATNIVRKLNMPTEKAYMATGMKFADALTGSVLAAEQKAPLLLTIPDRLPGTTDRLIEDYGMANFTILGGPASVTDQVMNSLPNYIPIDSGINYYVKKRNSGIALYRGATLVKDFGNTSFVLTPGQYTASKQIRINDRPYLGEMQFKLEDGYVRPINLNIPFDDYLKGVVPNEMPASWHSEALKAQAVAARTYSIDEVGNVVKDNQSFQVYGGYMWNSGTYSDSNKAVEATSGKELYYNNRLISAVFSSSNGGMTESNANEWGSTPLPYLPVQPDTFDDVTWGIELHKTQIDMFSYNDNLKNPGHWWEKIDEVDDKFADNIKDWLNTKAEYKNTEIKLISIPEFSMNLNDTYNSGRSKYGRLRVEFYARDRDTGNYRYDTNGYIKKYTVDTGQTLASDIRVILGTLYFKSTYITNLDSSGASYQVSGRGFGHGVGMSQHGAKGRAEAGIPYEEILEFYYPGTILK
ncbi:SpoIID/LytB domain-containing protein [Pseudalkalibacillus decolorationis]|uniref:SpoIID/LytB domain-containing protein n=1 Tax=Pseudalkalibacillus decolorationis TaxID=163879 RepID=UPI002148C639|nr:SpoIID/LytB domain-containing protein [Pseudalkalibacillus decolorationis]